MLNNVQEQILLEIGAITRISAGYNKGICWV